MQKFRSVLPLLTKLQPSRHLYKCHANLTFCLLDSTNHTELSKAVTGTAHLKYQNQSKRARSMSTDAKESLIAQHDAKSKKFFIKLGDGTNEAKLEYTKRGDVLNLWHTEVPPALQGKGIAKILAKEAFDHVIKNDLKMKLTCTYLQKYYQDNPKDEYKERVVS